MSMFTRRKLRQRCLEQLEPRQMLTAVSEFIADIREGQKGSNAGPEFFEFKDELYFAADDGIHGKELWKTDGTEEGTVMVKDISAGDESSFPGWFVEYKDELYFSASDVSNGQELWKTDGTAAGTTAVADIRGGNESSVPTGLTLFDGEVYFSASDSQDNDELWKSDGTAGGTKMVSDIRPGRSSTPGNSSGLVEHNGFLYFNARDNTNGVELWRSDGTDAGTTLVIDADPAEGSSWPSDFFTYQGDLYFLAEVFNAEFNSYFAHLFVVNEADGTAQRAVDMPIELLEGVIVVGDYMYFAGLDNEVGYELFRSDGTNEGTTLTRNIMEGSRDSNPRNFYEHDGNVYFAAGDSRDPETERPVYNMWVTDGTPLGTRKVAPDEIDAETPFLAFGEDVYYMGRSDEAGWELFKTDGTLDGSGIAADINPEDADGFGIPKVVFDDQLLLLATTASDGWEIWSFDGENATMIDTHFGGGDITESPTIFEFYEFGNDLVYFGSNPFDGGELHIIRSTAEPGGERFPGDADENGKVEFADFLLLSDNFGNQNAVWGDGDFDGNGKVEFADFLLLSDNFGKSAPVAAISAAGEPTDNAALEALAVDHAFANNANEGDRTEEDRDHDDP